MYTIVKKGRTWVFSSRGHVNCARARTHPPTHPHARTHTQCNACAVVSGGTQFRLPASCVFSLLFRRQISCTCCIPLCKLHKIWGLGGCFRMNRSSQQPITFLMNCSVTLKQTHILIPQTLQPLKHLLSAWRIFGIHRCY